MVYTIVVHLHAKDDKECIEKLKAKLAEASAVYSQDKETLGWFVSESYSSWNVARLVPSTGRWKFDEEGGRGREEAEVEVCTVPVQW